MQAKLAHLYIQSHPGKDFIRLLRCSLLCHLALGGASDNRFEKSPRMPLLRGEDKYTLDECKPRAFNHLRRREQHTFGNPSTVNAYTRPNDDGPVIGTLGYVDAITARAERLLFDCMNNA